MKAEAHVVAREIVDRAIEKIETFGKAATVAVVDPGGFPLSISRMDGAPNFSMVAARAKAVVAAITRDPTSEFSARMLANPIRYQAYLQMFDLPTFPGPGGLPIFHDGELFGGFAITGIPPYRSLPGVDPDHFKVEGSDEPGCVEDLASAHALGTPYREQHK